REDALAKIALSGIRSDGAIGTDRQPGVEFGWINMRAMGSEDSLSARAEAHHQGATSLQKITPGRSHVFCSRHIFEWRAACERVQSSGTRFRQVLRGSPGPRRLASHRERLSPLGLRR